MVREWQIVRESLEIRCSGWIFLSLDVKGSGTSTTRQFGQAFSSLIWHEHLKERLIINATRNVYIYEIALIHLSVLDLQLPSQLSKAVQFLKHNSRPWLHWAEAGTKIPVDRPISLRPFVIVSPLGL